MTTYNRSNFIRKGNEKVKTCVISEAQYPGKVMNVQDFSEYDQGDTDLGVFLNDVQLSTAHGAQATNNGRGFFVPMNDCAGVEVNMTEAGVGTISAGAYVKVTTGGEITTWSYVDGQPGSDTFRDVIGRAAESIATDSTGWVKLGRL